MSGCVTETGADTTIDIVFDPCETVVLQVAPDHPGALTSTEDAIAMWNEVTTVRFSLAPVADAPVIPIRFEESLPAFRGIYLDEIGEIVINRGITDRRALAITIAHELGHALGLTHVPADERPSVMNPGNYTRLPNAEDATELSGLWGGCATGGAGARPVKERIPKAALPDR